MQAFRSQFAHPQGFLGNLAGAIMAIENRRRNQWAISLLDLQATDRVLEIGFGPGWAIAEMSKTLTHGKVVGVDASETMVVQAANRNRHAIRAGRVELKHAPATKLPFANDTFDKVLTVNSLPFWEDAHVGLNEIKRVLKTGGRIVVVLQPVWAKSNAEVERGAQELNELIGGYFTNVRQNRQIARPPLLAIIAEK
jgi:ubiquinone/menaquinone biosynthesis C-methylase UbiE